MVRIMMKTLFYAVLSVAVVTAGAAMVPDGFYYEKNDHLQTRSESLFFTYKFSPGDEDALRRGVKFELSNLDNEIVRSGESREFELRDGLAIYRLLPPAEMAELPSAWYNLAIAPAGDETNNMFDLKFQLDSTPYRSRVVYLLDNATPEGYARWLNREFPGEIEPLRDFPEDGSAPAAVIISSYREVDAPTVEKLRNYVENGGTLLFFGVNHPSLDSLNPLAQNRDDLYSYTPSMAVQNAELPELADFAVYPVNATAAPEAEILATADDGKILAAVKPVGSGRSYAFAGALKPNAGYRAMLAKALQLKSHPLPSTAPVAGADGFTEGISRNNIGRFGFLNTDRTNDLSIRPENIFRLWDLEQDTFAISFTDSDEPGEIACVEANYLQKTLRGKGGRFGEETIFSYGLGTPGILFENPMAESFRFESPMIGHIAYPTENGIVVNDLARERPDLTKLSQNWFLVWNSTSKYDAWPLLVTLNRKVHSVENSAPGKLKLAFAEPGLAISVMPLAGARHFTPDEVAAWNPTLPETIAVAAEHWARALSARTTGCMESYRINPDKTVTIRNQFTLRELPNEWNISAEPRAYLPPLLPIYAKTGFARLPDNLEDLSFATLHGPLAWVPGDTVEYTLSIPDPEYTMPVTPTDPRLDCPANKTLFNRIIDHLDEAGLTYIPARFAIVEPQPGRIYPERDLADVVKWPFSTDAPSWKYIDIHLSWGGVTGNLMFKPYLDAVPGYDEVKARLETKIRRNIKRDIEYFQYKTFLLYRNEPFSNQPYLMAFISPVRFNDGYRTFHDMNETTGIIMQTLALYDNIYHDRDFLESNREYFDLFMSYTKLFNDWAWMSSIAVEWGMGNNIDMLNAELPAWTGRYRIDRTLGRDAEADFALYMAAKAGASAGARLFFGDFYNSLNFPIPPQLAPQIHEMKDSGQTSMTRNNYLPFQLAQGYGEGWPSLWPSAMNKGLVMHAYDGKDFYSTSKGVPIELVNFYRSSPEMCEVLGVYENAFRQFAFDNDLPYLYSRIAGDVCLNPVDRGELEKRLNRTWRFGGMTAKSLGMGVADWETTAMSILLEELRRSADQDELRFTVPVEPEKWEAVWPKSGPAPECKPVDTPEGRAMHFRFQAPTPENVPVAFARFDKKSVADKKCAALSFRIKSPTPGGTLDIALPETDWTKNPVVSLPIDESMRDGKVVRLEFERDFKLGSFGMKPENLRGELFFYNGIVPGKTRGELNFELTDIRFEP